MYVTSSGDIRYDFLFIFYLFIFYFFIFLFFFFHVVENIIIYIKQNTQNYLKVQCNKKGRNNGMKI